jgi:hypothetical protein
VNESRHMLMFCVLTNQVKFKSFHYVFVPVCVARSSRTRSQGDHWLIVVADMLSHSVLVLNSMQDEEQSNHYASLLRYAFMHNLSILA